MGFSPCPVLRKVFKAGGLGPDLGCKVLISKSIYCKVLQIRDLDRLSWLGRGSRELLDLVLPPAFYCIGRVKCS
jgi:hypothetical protein